MSKNIVVVFAGGSGTRMGISEKPKQFLKILGKSIIMHTIEHFQKNQDIDEIYVVCLKDWIDYLQNEINECQMNKVAAIIEGGNTGQDSIYRGLLKAKESNTNDSIVLIHDGVRPIITQEVISNSIKGVKEKGTSITYTPCTETIVVSKDKEGITDIPYRKDTLAVQAPQGFFLGEIISAHNEIRKTNINYENIVDSCTLYYELGKPVNLVKGNSGNVKVTTPEDYHVVKAIMDYRNSKKGKIEDE